MDLGCKAVRGHLVTPCRVVVEILILACLVGEVRAAIVYVLMNHKKHSVSGMRTRLDSFSSAAWFDGFTARAGPLVVTLRDRLPSEAIPVVRPRTWLLREGWRRRGLIAPGEGPVH